MKMKFQVIRDGATVFETSVEEINQHLLPVMTAEMLTRFQKEHAEISLLNQDVIMKWSEV